MSLRISFKPGKKQSHDAARYFHCAVGSLVESMIDGMEERSYLIAADNGAALRLRTWCAVDLDEQELHELMTWLMTLREEVQVLFEEPCGPGELGVRVGNWLAVRLAGVDLFVELSMAHPDTRKEEEAAFSLGMVRGRSVMVSTDTLLFTWLQDDVFGLSVAGHGSYLLELEDDSGMRAWRKAS